MAPTASQKSRQKLQSGESNQRLQSEEIHGVLSNERRQMIFQLLDERDGTISVRELSEQIAEFEVDTSPPPQDVRRSVYAALHQTHLPKLDELDIVTYDRQSKTITASERLREVSVYMDAASKNDVPWHEYYLGISLIGLLLIIAAMSGMPVLSAIDGSILALALLLVIIASAAYQTLHRDNSISSRAPSDKS